MWSSYNIISEIYCTYHLWHLLLKKKITEDMKMEKTNSFNNFTIEQLELLASLGIRFLIEDGEIKDAFWE